MNTQPRSIPNTREVSRFHQLYDHALTDTSSKTVPLPQRLCPPSDCINHRTDASPDKPRSLRHDCRLLASRQPRSRALPAVSRLHPRILQVLRPQCKHAVDRHEDREDWRATRRSMPRSSRAPSRQALVDNKIAGDAGQLRSTLGGFARRRSHARYSYT